MSTSIDQRIVSMKFDNAQFEAGAKQSINTLDKLKESVDLGKSANGLKELGNAANNFSVANIEHGLSNLGRGFSVLEVAAITAVSNITSSLMNKLGNAISNTLGLIYSGGLRRATNLEQARFSMQGLLYDTNEAGKQILNYGITVEDVMSTNGPVQTAVRGTAFGLDEAAKAASNFIASGVTDLGELEEVLKSISGTAAQTGGSYEEIAHIYQRIAGNNRVYAIDLQSFAARGVNAAAALAKSLGKTEVEVREMVSNGQVDLKIFSKAMYDAFGENAFRANETYSGSLSNLKAALSRLGAKFESKKLENMRDIFNALRPTVDALSAALDPLITMVVDLSTAISQFAIGKIDKIQKYFKSFTEDKPRAEKYLKVFDDLSEGLSETQKVIEKAKLEEQVITPVDHLVNAFKNLVASIKNVGAGLRVIIDPILNVSKGFISGYKEGKSFAEIIENISSKILNLTEKFKKITFSNGFKNVLVYLASAASAVWNVFDVLYKTAVNLATALKNVLGPVITTLAWTFSLLTKPLLNLITNFGEIIRENRLIELSFKKLTDILNGTLRPVLDWFWATFLSDGEPTSLLRLYDVVDWLTEGFAKLAIKAEDFLEGESDYSKIGETIVSVFEKIKNLLSPVAEGFDKLKEKVTGFFKGMSSNSEGFSVFESLTKLLEKAGNIITNVATKIWEGFGKIGEGIRNVFTGPNLTSAAGAVAIFGAGGILYKLTQFQNGLRKFDEYLPGLRGSIQNLVQSVDVLFRGLIGTLRTFKESFQIKTIKEISTALLIFSAALFVLSTINPARLLSASVAAGAALYELTLAFKSLTVFSKNTKGMVQTTQSIISLSVAILLLSVAFRSLSKLSWDEIGKGLVSLSALFTLLIGYVAATTTITKQSGSLKKGASTLIALAIAIDLLVIAVKKLGEMDVETLMKGITSVALLLTGLMIFTKFSDADKMGFSSGAGILLLSTALLVLTSAVKILGAMDTGQLVQGLIAIGSALLGIAVFVKILEGTKPISAAAGLLIAAAALVVIANAIKRLTEFDSVALSVSLGMILIALGGITLALSILEQTSSLKTAVGLLLVATAVATLAEAFLVLALVPADKLAVGLLAMLAGLVGIGAAAWLLQPVAGTMVLVAGAMTLFGVGVLALAAGLAILAPIMVTFATAFIGSLSVLLTGFITMRQQIVDGMIALITSLLDAIIATAPKFKEAFIVIVTAILEAFVELFSIIVQAIVDLIIAIAAAMVELIPLLADSALKIIFGIMEVILANIFEFVVIGIQIVTELLNGLAAALPDLINAGFNLIISFIDGLATAIDENAERLGEAAWRLVKSLFLGIVNGFKGFMKEPLAKIKELGSKMISKLKEFISFKKLKEIGENLIKGLKEGILSLKDKAVDAVKNIGTKLLDGFKNILGIHSPSTKFLECGENIVKGVDDGLKKNSAPQNTITSFASTLLDKFKGLFNRKEAESVSSDFVDGVDSGLHDDSQVTNTSESLATRLVRSFKDKLTNKEGSSTGSTYITGLNAGMLSISSTDTIADILAKIKNALNKKDDFETIGKNLMDGMRIGISRGTPGVEAAATHAGTRAVEATKNATYVYSPSRLFMEIGEYCMEGFAIGLGETGKVEKQIATLKDTLTNSLTSKLLDVEEFDPVIKPVLDLSGIQNGMTSIDNMFGARSNLLGSVSGNVTASQTNVVASAISALTDRLSQKFNDTLTSDDIYDAIRLGAANAQFTVILNGRDITSTVNDYNANDVDTLLSYMGG